jgi:hypothetical protein
VCKRACEVAPIGTAVLFPEHGYQADKKLQMIFRCPRQSCGSLFILEYSAEHDGRGSYCFTASNVYPRSTPDAEVAEGVSDISPNFVKILNQSMAAESHNLDQIVGIGLRKALEFLTKDYCIHKFPDKADEISARPLGQCITDYVIDQNIQSCAKRAAWLGNDETHYARIWSKHDITDLKILIRLTQNWISNELLTQKYLSELPEKPKTGGKPDEAGNNVKRQREPR